MRPCPLIQCLVMRRFRGRDFSNPNKSCAYSVIATDRLSGVQRKQRECPLCASIPDVAFSRNLPSAPGLTRAPSEGPPPDMLSQNHSLGPQNDHESGQAVFLAITQLRANVRRTALQLGDAVTPEFKARLEARLETQLKQLSDFKIGVRSARHRTR